MQRCLISPCKALGLLLTTLLLSVRSVFCDVAAALLLQSPTTARQSERNARRVRAGAGCTQTPTLAMPGVLHKSAFAQALWQATRCQKAGETAFPAALTCLYLAERRAQLFYQMLPRLPPLQAVPSQHPRDAPGEHPAQPWIPTAPSLVQSHLSPRTNSSLAKGHAMTKRQ